MGAEWSEFLLVEMRFWMHMARLGVISHETFRREADRWIEELEQPPIGLIELSLAKPSEWIHPPDALHAPLAPADGLRIAELLRERHQHQPSEWGDLCPLGWEIAQGFEVESTQFDAFWDFGTLVSCLSDGTTTEEAMPLAELFHRLIAAVQGGKPMLPWD